MGFIRSIALRYAHDYQNARMDADDYTQEGAVALLRAASQYDPSREVQFLTYAGRAVRYAIIDAIRADNPNIVLTPLDEAHTGSADDSDDDSDLFAGRIARKYRLVTNFGKLMDPLADKLLVCSALICLVELERIPAWVVIVIIAREFVISGIRLIAADDGVVISASKWGKVKTVFQMIMVGFMIGNVEMFSIITMLLMWIALALTIISLVDYVIKNIDLLKDIG